jgi:hypothetical protein
MLSRCEAASRNFRPLAVGEITATVNELVEGTECDGIAGGWTQHFLKRNEEKPFTCFPQNVTSLRKAWSSHANASDGFDMAQAACLQTGIAVKNRLWESASEEDKQNGAVLETLIVRPDLTGGVDEMPLAFAVSRGEKGKKDEKVACKNATTHAVLKDQKHKATARGQQGTAHGRQVSDKNNKRGTRCGDSKANGERWPDLLTVKGEDFKADPTRSWTEGRDGQGEKITLPDAFVAGQRLPGRAAVTSNGGVNAELFWECVQTMVLPCCPTTRKGHDEVVLCFDGDESHWLKGEQHRELKEKGFHVIAPKPNTTTDAQ